MLFVLTKELKMHILDYSESEKALVPISTFTVDIGSTGEKLKEVLKISYDPV
jgi:hypothetical protein